jgi:hypothetical protein
MYQSCKCLIRLLRKESTAYTGTVQNGTKLTWIRKTSQTNPPKVIFNISVSIRDALDIDFAGYLANLKAGFRISGTGRIPDIRPDINSTCYCLVKYKINKRHQMYWSISFPVLKQSIFYFKAVTVSRINFWKFYELMWLSIQFGRISGRISSYF